MKKRESLKILEVEEVAFFKKKFNQQNKFLNLNQPQILNKQMI